jgi:hypothetical protein
MKGFLLGLIVAGVGFAGYYYLKGSHFRWPLEKPAATVDAGAAPPKDAREKKKKRRRGAVREARNEVAEAPAPSAAPAEPEPVKLSPADLKLVSQGDDLSRPDVVHLGDATDDTGSRELTQDDIDAKFHAKEEAILGCISKARPDEDTYVPGRVTVKFRIQRTGNVRGVRVEAPSILQKGGIYGCIKGVVGGIRFPPSSSSQVVSYPFSLT